MQNMPKYVGEPYVAVNRKNSSNGIYAMYWTDRFGLSHEKSLKTTNYAEAQGILATWLQTGNVKNVLVDIEDEQINPLLDQYLLKKQERVIDFERIKFCVTALKVFCTRKFVADIDEDFCLEYVEFRIGGGVKKRLVKVSSAVKELKCLRVALNICLPKSIAIDIKMHYPNAEEVGVTGLRCEEAMKLYKAACKLPRAKEYLLLFLKIGFKTGRRKKSILRLKWSQVDLKKGIIFWNDKETSNDDEHSFKKKKSKKKTRQALSPTD